MEDEGEFGAAEARPKSSFEPIYVRVKLDAQEEDIYEELSGGDEEERESLQLASLASNYHPDFFDPDAVKDDNDEDEDRFSQDSDVSSSDAADENNNDVYGDFMSSEARLRQSGWYWGPLSRLTAQQVVAQQPNGAFLIRDSSHDCYLLTVTVKANDRIYHIRLEHVENGRFTFDARFNEHLEPSDVVSYLKRAMKMCRQGTFRFVFSHPEHQEPGVDTEVQFLFPVSRFAVLPVPSLKHLARFVVLSRVRKDHIERLDAPDHVKAYLNESQIYVELDQRRNS